MNKLFKKDRIIKLDEFYTLESDSFNGVVLIFSEPRKKKKKDSEIEEDYIFIDKWYYTRVNDALNKYAELSMSDFSNLKELSDKVTKTFETIKEFATKFKNW